MGTMQAPVAADLPGARHLCSGKVRDLYELDDGRLLMVASDRISAFDYVLDTTIPDKGVILTRMSLWWFEQLADLAPNHVLSATLPAGLPADLAGRAVACKRLEMFPVECVARGYLTGSGLLDYNRTGEVCGIPLPPGLVDGSRLPEPVFTPATKAEFGEHDQNIAYDDVVAAVGADTADQLRALTLAVYSRGEQIARDRGIILADTKVEFGRRPTGTTDHATGGGSASGGDDIVLADEVLTPDSSRFWPADQWDPGRPQPSFDKQFVRDWLTSPESGWDRASGEPPPPLPDRVVEQTRDRYVEALERLTGQRF